MSDFVDNGCSNDGDEMERTVVIDNGSGFIKAGFAGDEITPNIVFPSVLGRPRAPGVIVGEEKEYYIGEEAERMAGMLKCCHPIQSGVIVDWESMERIWSHVFYNELRVAPEKQRVTLTEPPVNPKSNRERILHIMFEKFNVVGLHLVNQFVLSLYSTGKTTGLVINCGYDDFCIAPIYEGSLIPHAVRRLGIGGRDVTACLRQLLIERGYCFHNNAGDIAIHTCDDIKKKLAYVALDFDTEMAVSISRDQCPDLVRPYELPSGQHVVIGNERFRCAEVLFQPSIIGKTGRGLHQLCEDLDVIDMKRELFDHVVLCGGSSLFPGIEERLQKEMKHFVPREMAINITALPDRNISAWVGGSMLGGLSCYQSMFVKKCDYERDGYSALVARCGEY